MPPRKQPPEAWQDLKDVVRPVFEPPLLRMVQALQRHIDRHPHFYRAVRVIR
jgi:hypothetical protein